MAKKTKSTSAPSRTRSKKRGSRSQPRGRSPKKRKARRKAKGWSIRAILRRWWLGIALVAAALPVAFLAAFAGNVPLPQAVPGAESSQVFAADGSVIATLHAEENRTIVPLEAISQDLRDAIIATEDRTYFEHPGVSLRGIIRAAWINFRSDEVVQGGSTITQQYVRNAFAEVGQERTLVRKLREAALAVKLEREHSKEGILGFYLNTVYFGRGAYGAEAAARSYFSKSASDITLPEAAYMAGAIRAPERYQPDSNPESAEAIRLEVIGDMQAAGLINDEEAEQARAAEIEFRLSRTESAGSASASYFTEFIKGKLYDEFDFSDAEIFGGGLQIHTTLDPKMQKAAEDAVASTLDRDTDPEAALVAVDTDGRVRAMVGGRVVDDVERARGTNFAAPRAGGGRQAGSAFKPFTLAAFIDQGYSIRSVFTAPALLEVQAPQCRDRTGENWLLSNFADAGYAPMDVISATARSINTVYAQMMEVTKPRAVARMAEAAGIESPLDRVCSLSLGTSDVTPLEMARAYATFANRGERPDLLYVTKIVTPGGRVIHEAGPTHERTIDRAVADTVNHVLQRTVTSGTGRRHGLPRSSAAKSGTTQNFRDAWFVGYVPQLAVAVWMGYAVDAEGEIAEMTNVRGSEVTGSSLPGLIWRRFMMVALEDIEPAAFPSVSIRGEEIKASPTPCPTTSPGPYPGAFCATPSPSPSPPPSPSPQPSPSPSPSPSPTPTPSPEAENE